MKAEGLLEHYARMADAPDAIDRLRRFVLDLAVAGKLVVQSAEDEPAPKLLGRIAKEKTRLIKEGTAKQAKRSADVGGDAEFEIPSTWTWTRLGVVASYVQRGKSPKYAEQDGLPVVSQKCVQWSGLDLTAAKKVTIDSLTKYEGIRFLRDGDLLWNSTGTGTIGRVIRLVRPPAQLVCDSHVTVVRCLIVFPEYIRIWLCSDHVYGRVEGRASGSTNQVELTAQMANSQVVPLPPVEEQHRIVAKVEELMALCDQLEAARAQREATRDQLAAASLARLNVPDPGTFHADARFALDALPALTTRPDQIKQLRQTILNLAVRGKLVPQNPADEHSSVLLAKIRAQKIRQIEAGQVPRAKASARDTSRLDDSLPLSWTPIALGDVCSLVTSGSRGWADYYADKGAGFIRAQNIRFGVLNLEEMARVNPPENSEGARTKVEKGDLLVVITGAGVTNPSLLNIELGEAYVSQHVGLVRPTEKQLSKWLLLCLMADEGGRAELVERAYGAGKPGLNLDNIRSLSVPLPPLEEQERIVARVDELMALCDQLEASLTTGVTTRRCLLDALLHEALAPVAAPSSEHPRAAVSGYVVSRLASRRNFGRTAHMKHLYFAESRLGLNLGGRYMREAAGPLDTGIYELEKQAEAAGWYTRSVETLASGNEKVSYKPGNAIKAIAEEGIAVLGPSRAEMDRLIDLMGGLKTEQVEIIATLFAAWNDALLDGQSPVDDWIIREVREHWHVRKQRFAPADLHKWLGWMRQNDVVPLGHPPRTMQQTTMEL